MVKSSQSALPSVVATVAIAAALSYPAHAFIAPQRTSAFHATEELISTHTSVDATRTSRQQPATCTALLMSTPATGTESLLSLSLEKPLGLILEEPEDGSGGVIVTQVNEGGSAFDSPSADKLVNAKISTVMERDVSSLPFDDVMDAIIEAPSPLDIAFSLPAGAAVADGAAEDAPPTFEVGSTVAITVQQPDKPDLTIDAKVGDNLRKTLLANDVEVYRGLKKKLGNCGGGGQCGFCAVELVDEGEGVWGERSDYEAQRIGKNGGEGCRLACMNNIVGPATVRTL